MRVRLVTSAAPTGLYSVCRGDSLRQRFTYLHVTRRGRAPRGAVRPESSP